MNRLTAPWPDPAAYDLTVEFVRANYEHELEYLPIVVEYVQTRIQKAPAPDRSSEFAKTLRDGLPFASEQSAQLVSPFVLLTLDAVMRELNRRGLAPSQLTIDTAVQSAAAAFGASPLVARELVRDVSPKLADLFCNEKSVAECNVGDRPIGRSTTGTDPVIVTRLSCETPVVSTSECPRTEAEKWAYESRYDLVVNELSYLITVRRKGKPKHRPLGEVGRALRALLWLALTNVETTFPFDALRNLCDLEHAVDDKQLSSIVYQYRDRLKKLLGVGLAPSGLKKPRNTRNHPHTGESGRSQGRITVIERMLENAGPRTYYVPSVGWSFCWLRRSMHVRDSVLIRIHQGKLERPSEPQ